MAAIGEASDCCAVRYGMWRRFDGKNLVFLWIVTYNSPIALLLGPRSREILPTDFGRNVLRGYPSALTFSNAAWTTCAKEYLSENIRIYNQVASLY